MISFSVVVIKMDAKCTSGWHKTQKVETVGNFLVSRQADAKASYNKTTGAKLNQYMPFEPSKPARVVARSLLKHSLL